MLHSAAMRTFISSWSHCSRSFCRSNSILQLVLTYLPAFRHFGLPPASLSLLSWHSCLPAFLFPPPSCLPASLFSPPPPPYLPASLPALIALQPGCCMAKRDRVFEVDLVLITWFCWFLGGQCSGGGEWTKTSAFVRSAIYIYISQIWQLVMKVGMRTQDMWSWEKKKETKSRLSTYQAQRATRRFFF